MSTGIVALVGEAQGGSPYNGSTPVHKVVSPGAVSRAFLSGDLVEAAALAFDPSNDAAIPGGAQELRIVKVNPSTPSTLTLLDASLNGSIDLTSLDSGLHTTQINIDVSAGTTKGKLYTIVFQDTTETFDNVGGDNVWTTQFTQGTNAMTTVTAALDNTTGVTGLWTRANTGLDGDIVAAHVASENGRVVSTDGGDTTQTITIYGLDASGAPQTETLSLNGTNAVVGVATWQANGILGCIMDSTATGTVSVTSSPTVATIVFSLTAGQTTKGVLEVDNGQVQSGIGIQVTASSAPAGAREIIIFGLAGQTGVAEAITVSGATPVVGAVLTFTEVTVICLGEGDAAITWTTQGTAFALIPSGYPTVKEVVDRISVLNGWVASVSAVPALSPGDLLISDLDELAAVDVISPSVLGTFYGDLALSLAALNTSGLISAARASGASAPPDNTASPLFLNGGVEGTTAFADWQAAFDLLRDEQISTIVPLTSDPAVHAAGDTHCAYMAGPGKRERDMIVGSAAGTAKAAVQAEAQQLNTRHVRYLFQEVQRFNTDGEEEWFPPYMFAAAVAGAQAGSAIAEPLTFKFFKALDVRQDSSIVLQDDANEMIQSGLWFLERVPNVGYRNARNITTWLIDNNLAYIEGSVNEAVNFATQNLRTNMEIAVGRKGFRATINQSLSTAVDVLAAMVDLEVLVTWRNLTITLSADVMELDVEIAAVNPVNFVKNNIHVVSARFAAAA